MVKKLLLLASIGYTIALIVVSFINLHGVPELGSSFDDKLYHALAYFILAFLWIVYKKFGDSKILVFQICLLVILFGIVIEFLQHRINPNRAFDLYDILANSIGALLGTLIAAKLNVLKLK